MYDLCYKELEFMFFYNLDIFKRTFILLMFKMYINFDLSNEIFHLLLENLWFSKIRKISVKNIHIFRLKTLRFLLTLHFTSFTFFTNI